MFVMKIYSVAVNGVPQDWLDEMASMARAVEQEFAEGSQS
ncbi:hypothetical protein L579_3727 [Pantoea sp. AS-PWVM4]|nr:hypothetical protein L579_3727 [Pantoea sp. AS-PWVM4]